MAFILKLYTVLAIATLSSAQFTKSKLVKKYSQQPAIETQPPLLTILQAPESNLPPPSLPIGLELPKEEAPGIPFYTPESIKTKPYYLDYPIPSQELQLPSIESWNPNNDPKFYYEIPAAVTKQDLPTKLHPKKYNKDIYEKQKPNKPKQEISLLPITEQDYVDKQKSIDKVLLNLAKVQHKKYIDAEKVQSKDIENEPQAAASGIESFHGFHHSEPLHLDSSSSSSHLNSHSAPANRLDFQMHGHDGPYSYKWGYDTGKGHNRQFRFEERDKHGYVKGHYGYFDKEGKLQMVHYNADPHQGFQVEA